MGLALTYVSVTWLLYAVACLLIIAFFFQAPRLTPGSVGLAALLVQQALGTVAAVVLFSADSSSMVLQAFQSGSYAWILWTPLVFLAAPLILHGSRLARPAWLAALVGGGPTIALVALSFWRADLLLTNGIAYTPFATACLLLVFVAFASTVGLLFWEALTTPAPLRRAQMSLLACAFALEGGFHAAQNVVKAATGADFHGQAGTTGIELGLTLAAAAAFAALLAWAALVAFRAAHPDHRRWARALMIALVVALATGAATANLISGEEFREPSGLFHAAWDLAGLCLLVFAALRYQLFAIEMRARQAITLGTVLVTAFVAFAVIENLVENFLQARYFGALPASGTIAGVVVAGLSTQAVKAGKFLAHLALPGVAHTVDYERKRHEDLYRAALEGAFLDGVVSPAEANSIRLLREKLHITPEDHARLEAQVRLDMQSKPGLGAVAAPA